MAHDANAITARLPSPPPADGLKDGTALAQPLAISRLWKPALLGAVMLWTFWPTLVAYADRWWKDPKYTHGYIVPLFALYLLWERRQLKPTELRPTWWGVAVLALAAALNLSGAYFFLNWLNGLAVLVGLTGLVLFLGGRPALRWSWPAIAFLGFMLPLPYRVEVGASVPLQRIATVSSTYVLQTLGFPAVSSGNIIIVNKLNIGVAEACSGLSMLFTFCAISAAVAILMRRPLADRIVVLVSAIPIAIVSNIFRIVLYVVLYDRVGKHWAEDFYHHRAGWIMMLLALGLLWLELQFMSRLLVVHEQAERGPLELETITVAPAANARPGSKKQARAARR
jgi:exosortase